MTGIIYTLFYGMISQKTAMFYIQYERRKFLLQNFFVQKRENSICDKHCDRWSFTPTINNYPKNKETVSEYNKGNKKVIKNV
jgi:hypothetical protein